MRETDGNIAPLVGAGLLIGIGMGGFFDRILLHQILQWHNMLSTSVPPTNLVDMKYNMIWDRRRRAEALRYRASSPSRLQVLLSHPRALRGAYRRPARPEGR